MSFTIKELELLTGIKAHTIRIWEQRYGLLRPTRTGTNIRRYNNEELKTLLTISLLTRHGFKISRLGEMHPEQRAQAVLELETDEAANEAIINSLLGQTIDLDSVGFELSLSNEVGKRSLEGAMVEIIFPFLARVGILWQTDRLRPAQEHVISSVIRQKIIVAIEQLPVADGKPPLVALFLPQGELHELGLLYVHYLLRKAGITTLYLGANVPVKDLEYITEIKPPDYLYLHLTTFPGQDKFDRLIQQIHTAAKASTIIISGHAVNLVKPSHKKIIPLSSLETVQSFIGSLKEKHPA